MRHIHNAGTLAGANVNKYTTVDLTDPTFNKDRSVLFQVASQPIIGAIDGKQSTDKKMLSRHYGADGSYYLSVVSNGYRAVENAEILFPLQDQIVNFFDPLVAREVAVRDIISRNGAVCYSEYVLPKISGSVETRNGHRTNFGLTFMLKNTFDGSGSVILYSGLIDFFCLNGRITGEFDVTKRRHTANFNANDFSIAFENTLKRFDKVVQQYQYYADSKITDGNSIKPLFEKLTGQNTERARERQRSTLADKLFGQYAVEASHRGNSIFSVMSAMTHYASHNEGDFTYKSNADEGTMVKRQEQVGKWLSSDTWRDFVVHNGAMPLELSNA
jgi:hypothetical protein